MLDKFILLNGIFCLIEKKLFLQLLVGWRQGHLACKNLHHLATNCHGFCFRINRENGGVTSYVSFELE